MQNLNSVNTNLGSSTLLETHTVPNWLLAKAELQPLETEYTEKYFSEKLEIAQEHHHHSEEPAHKHESKHEHHSEEPAHKHESKHEHHSEEPAHKHESKHEHHSEEPAHKHESKHEHSKESEHKHESKHEHSKESEHKHGSKHEHHSEESEVGEGEEESETISFVPTVGRGAEFIDYIGVVGLFIAILAVVIIWIQRASSSN